MQITSSTPLLLASASPRRREILSLLRIPYRAQAVDVDERRLAGECAETFLQRVVRDKLAAACRLERHGEPAVLVADTIVVVDGDVLGKPVDEDDAYRLLTRISGRSHIVYTRYAIAGETDEPLIERTVNSSVTMHGASPTQLRNYARTGEGLDKAGAYAVQGIGAFLVEAIDGSYTNVVGLPACELVQDLQTLGLLLDYPPAQEIDPNQTTS